MIVSFFVGLAIIGGFEVLMQLICREYWITGFDWFDRAVAKCAVRLYDYITD
jgi:hypothetical protein